MSPFPNADQVHDYALHLRDLAGDRSVRQGALVITAWKADFWEKL